MGQDYPEDDMTWSEVLDLAQKVTGEIDGVEYHGIAAGHINSYMPRQLGLKFLDPETDEPLLESDPAFRYMLETIRSMATIPGNWPNDDENWMNNAGPFFSKGLQP